MKCAICLEIYQLVETKNDKANNLASRTLLGRQSKDGSSSWFVEALGLESVTRKHLKWLLHDGLTALLTVCQPTNQQKKSDVSSRLMVAFVGSPCCLSMSHLRKFPKVDVTSSNDGSVSNLCIVCAGTRFVHVEVFSYYRYWP